MAESRYIDESSLVFKAKFTGKCGNCGEPFEVDDEVRYDRTTLVGTTCCTIDAPSEGDTFNHSRDPAIRVMPHGKTKRDMCLKCFQIPSSNGSCGCDG